MLHIHAKKITLLFTIVVTLWTLFFTVVAVLSTLWLHKKFSLKNIAVSFLCIILSFAAAYGYYFYFIAFTDMGFFILGSFALVMFLTQTIFWSVWFGKKERAFIVSLVAASGLALYLSAYSLQLLPLTFVNYLAPYRKPSSKPKVEPKKNKSYFPNLESLLKDKK